MGRDRSCLGQLTHSGIATGLVAGRYELDGRHRWDAAQRTSVRGWRVVARRSLASDNSSRQLGTVRRLAAAHSIPLTLLHWNAETVPYPDESFDFAISEYGAAIWCDPEVWIPEAYRLLRPDGTLTFLGNHPFAMVCIPPSGADGDERFHRPYFGMRMHDWRFVEIDPGGIDFNLTISGCGYSAGPASMSSITTSYRPLQTSPRSGSRCPESGHTAGRRSKFGSSADAADV